MGVAPLIIAGQAGIVAVATALPPDPEPTFGPTFWATVGLILTTLAGFAFQAYREARDRRWRAEDDAKKEVIRQVAVETKEVLAAKIDENTAISVAAFDAANNFNAKLREVREQVAGAPQERAAEAQERIANATEQMAATVEAVKPLIEK
jgi:hypothetical protein